MMRRFALIYLNAGNGHYAQASVLKSLLEKKYPDSKIILLHGFGKKRFLTYIFEQGYRISCNYIPGAFPLIYDLGQRKFFLNLLFKSLTPFIIPYAVKKLTEYEITDVISFHYATTTAYRLAIKKIGKDISLKTFCTDPFTGPNAWFYEKHEDIFLYSNEMFNCGLQNRMSSQKMHIVPFLLNKNFVGLSELSKKTLKEQLGFDARKKLLLIAGGGEGLPGAEQIINECLRLGFRDEIAVVCGRNKVLKKYLVMATKLRPDVHIRIYGFVDNMNLLMRCADAIVTKSGASTIFEVMSTRTPVIISHYIHNQELGCMQFIVRNGLGFFIQNPKNIVLKVLRLFNEPSYLRRIDENYMKLSLSQDLSVYDKYF